MDIVSIMVIVVEGSFEGRGCLSVGSSCVGIRWGCVWRVAMRRWDNRCLVFSCFWDIMLMIVGIVGSQL